MASRAAIPDLPSSSTAPEDLQTRICTYGEGATSAMADRAFLALTFIIMIPAGHTGSARVVGCEVTHPSPGCFSALLSTSNRSSASTFNACSGVSESGSI
jgi:hypothetical protein